MFSLAHISLGARIQHLFRQRRQWRSIFTIECIYNSTVGCSNGVPLPPEVPYPIHPLQNKSGCQISVAVQFLARHLEVNCQYSICIILLIVHRPIYSLLSAQGHHITRKKTAVRGGGRPPCPPCSAATGVMS